MKPVAVTFVDDKFLHLAEEQAENFKQFDVVHKIVRIDDVKGYPTEHWIQLLDLTKAAIAEYGKVFRVDAEIRMHKPLPNKWIEADNVLFYFDPLIKWPWYVAINTGHMIISESGNGVAFLDTLKECILATIPPDNDTNLIAAGLDQRVEDEWPSAIAIRLSKIDHVKEKLALVRLQDTNAAATRGLWVTDNTIITHPGLHNWAIPGGGQWRGDSVTSTFFINHFLPHDLQRAKFVSKLMLDRNGNINAWKKIGATVNGYFELGGWRFDPAVGICAPVEYWDTLPKIFVD